MDVGELKLALAKLDDLCLVLFVDRYRNKDSSSYMSVEKVEFFADGHEAAGGTCVISTLPKKTLPRE